jgi:hypothetical protein
MALRLAADPIGTGLDLAGYAAWLRSGVSRGRRGAPLPADPTTLQPGGLLAASRSAQTTNNLDRHRRLRAT